MASMAARYNLSHARKQHTHARAIAVFSGGCLMHDRALQVIMTSCNYIKITCREMPFVVGSVAVPVDALPVQGP